PEPCGGRRSAGVDLRERRGRVDPRETRSPPAADGSDGLETVSLIAPSARSSRSPPPSAASGIRRASRPSAPAGMTFAPIRPIFPAPALLPRCPLNPPPAPVYSGAVRFVHGAARASGG